MQIEHSHLHVTQYVASLASIARPAAEAMGFRGINGLRPAKRGPPPFIPRSHCFCRSPRSPARTATCRMTRKLIMTTLYVREASGYREAASQDVIECAQGLIARRYRKGAPVMDSPDRTAEYLRLHLGALDHEVFGCLYLDNRHRLIAVEDLFRGTLDGASVHPREVVKAAIHHGAGACVLFHNHPSSCSTPSHADELITQRLKDALALIDVRVLDHFVVGDQVYS
ncbi:MAG: JAB domain-containing protein, partial [Steroidobacteraceae bacterium]